MVFLLYYLPSALHGILPDKYLVHALLLSKALRLLLQSDINHGDLRVAKRCLCLFWKYTELFYGDFLLFFSSNNYVKGC